MVIKQASLQCCRIATAQPLPLQSPCLHDLHVHLASCATVLQPVPKLQACLLAFHCKTTHSIFIVVVVVCVFRAAGKLAATSRTAIEDLDLTLLVGALGREGQNAKVKTRLQLAGWPGQLSFIAETQHLITPVQKTMQAMSTNLTLKCSCLL